MNTRKPALIAVMIIAFALVATSASADSKLEKFDDPFYSTTVCRYVASLGVLKHSMRLKADNGSELAAALQSRAVDFIMEEQKASEYRTVEIDREDAELVAGITLVVLKTLMESEDKGVDYYDTVSTGTDICMQFLKHVRLGLEEQQADSGGAS